MLVDSLLSQVLIALGGGAAAELLHWYALSRKPGEAEKYKVHPIYWITTAGMVVLGGLMPILYLEGAASALLCFHLGAATPVIVQKLIANVPEAAARQGPGEPTLRRFFRW
ncbi:hypothetical protein V5F72_10700 [Xanthobacter flavus]|uniref:hypothetical protein n=1 Tax=Xanthobacter flavus TaxID=281 RepID=UPI00372732D8